MFHTQRIDGRWWLVTPEGNAFFSAGVYCVRISGIPDASSGRRAYRENSLLAHGSEESWGRTALERLDQWGFNTIGDWSSQSVISRHRFAYCLSTSIGSLGTNVLSVTWSHFPDVFDPQFAEQSRERAQQLVKVLPDQVNDPWLLGYFIDDEAGFYGSENAWGSLVEDYAKLPADAPGKKALVDFLKVRYQTIDELNRAWQARYKSFEDLQRARTISGHIPNNDKSTFLESVCVRFVAPICEELRQLDPNHLILGPRPSRFYKEIMAGIGKYCDVINVSAYQLDRGYEIDPDFDRTVDGIARDSGRPVMLGFNMGARSPDYPKGQVRTQRDRGVSYERYLRKVCENRNVVGLHWFQYFDPPPANKQDTGNWGLVTEGDQPYKACVAVVAEANRALYRYLVPKVFADQPALPEFSFDGAEEPAQAASGSAVPVANGDFEARSETPWLLQKWQGQGRAALSKDNPHSGKQCLELQGSGAGWSSTVVAAQYGPAIKLDLAHRYRLSVWLRTEGLGTWAGVRLKVKRTDGSTGYVEAGIDKDAANWVEAATEFDNTTEKIESVEYLAVMLVGTGKAWADDVALEDLGVPKPEPKPEGWPVGITLSNPGAEELDSRGVPVGWTLQSWQGDGKATVDEQEAHSGHRSILLHGGSQPGWGSSVVAIQSNPPISLKAKQPYAFSAWVRTEGVETDFYLRIKVNYPDGKDEYVQGVISADLPAWTEVRKVFTLPRDARVEYIGGVLIGHGLAWIDDLSIKEIPQR